MDVVHSEIDALKSELLRLRAEIADLDSHGLGVEPSEAAPFESAEAATEADREQYDTYAAQLDHLLEEESEDAIWVHAVEAEVREAFAPLLPEHSRIESVCRSSLCRLEVTHRDAGGHEVVLSALQDNIPWDGPTIALPGSDGENRSLIYFARDGHQLPTVFEEPAL